MDVDAVTAVKKNFEPSRHFLLCCTKHSFKIIGLTLVSCNSRAKGIIVELPKAFRQLNKNIIHIQSNGQADVLHKIHEDLELLKRDMAEIKEVIRLEPELRDEVIEQVQEARERIAKGRFVSNEEILKEFDLE